MLPDATWQLVAPFFGLSLVESDISRMRQAALLYSKSRNGEEFRPDSVAKRKTADRHVHWAAETILQPALDLANCMRALT